MDCCFLLQEKLSADFKTTAVATPPTLLQVTQYTFVVVVVVVAVEFLM